MLHGSQVTTPVPPVPPELAARGVALRPATEADLDFLRDVYFAYRWEEVKQTGWPLESILAFLDQQFRLQHHHYVTHYGGGVFMVVEVNGTPAGRLYLIQQPGDLRVVDLAFLAEYRNQGIGTALLTAVQELARQSGDQVSIHVEQSNPALRLYERLGFKRTGEPRGVYYLMIWQP